MSMPKGDQAAAVEAIESLAVVMFTYNHRRFLRDALTGINAQRRRPERIVVCDDASPEDSEAELRSELVDFPGVELRRNPKNLGPVANFRQGIAIVQQDAYMLHAGDDRLTDEGFLSDAIDVLNANPTVVVVFGVLRRVDDAGHVLGPDARRAPRPVSFISGAEMRKRLAYSNPVYAPCAVVRNRVHESLPPFPLPSRLRHDWQQWYLLSYYGDFARIERVVMESVVHSANLSVGPEQSRAMAASLAQDVADLLERPEIQPADAARLREGLAAHSIRGAFTRDLLATAWRHREAGQSLRLLGASLADRLSRRLAKRARVMEVEMLQARLGVPVDLANSALSARTKPRADAIDERFKPQAELGHEGPEKESS